jgi:site-specific recombinase XerD
MNIPLFLEYLHTQDRAETTIAGYARDLAHFAAWFEQTNGRAPEPARVTPLDIRQYRQFLQRNQQMKPSSVNRRLATLRAYFSWAFESGLVASKPTNGVKLIKQTRRAPRWLSREQTYALVREAKEAIQLAEAKRLTPSANLARRDRAVLSLLLHGLRVSEVCALTLNDVVISDRKGEVTVRSGKGNVYREVPLNKDAREPLNEWLEIRSAEAGELLFFSRRGEPLQPRTVQRALDKLAQRAGLNPAEVTPHSLRHTFGKNLVDAGVSLDRVAMLLGHKDLSTTAIYTTPSRADLAAAVEQIVWED